jgi:hypothetical protein
MRAVFAAVFALLILIVCESIVPGPPLMVYATSEDETFLPTRLAEITDETGISVTVKYGDSGANTDAVIANTGSSLSKNRSLIAMMIQDLGVRPAERIVRGWVRNLAVSPFSTSKTYC